MAICRERGGTRAKRRRRSECTASASCRLRPAKTIRFSVRGRSPNVSDGWLREHILTRRPIVARRPDGTLGAEHGRTEIIRPGVPAAQGTPPSNAPPASESANPLAGIASPFDPTSIPSADARASARIGHPRAHTRDTARVRAIRRARDRSREYDPGRGRSSQGDRLARETAPHLHSR